MAAVPSIGRATRVERPTAPGADAAGVLYERYSSQIHSYCLHQLGSREEAEDAVQTTFMNAFRGLSRGIVPELESAWLFKIAHNVCLSRRRSSWRRGRVESPNNFEVLQEVVPGREQVADELIRLQDVLEDMPENQRRAILLREWQGLTYREIADELDLSQAAVETLIFRARRALAAGLEQDADTWKTRLRRGSDFGGIAGCLQALLGGSTAAAVKVAVTAVAVATTAVAAAPTHSPTHAQHAPAAKHAKAPADATRSTPLSPTSAATVWRHPSSASSERLRAAVRHAPKPVALPASSPEAVTGAPAPAATPPQATPPPADPPSTPVANPPTSPFAPAVSSPPKDKGGHEDRLDRKPQATTPAPVAVVPEPPVSAPVAQPPAEQAPPAEADKPGNSAGQPGDAGKPEKRKRSAGEHDSNHS
jgi:RNA polymerase sigma factor (sigma-70 family)